MNEHGAAPRDGFVIANRDCVASTTGLATIEALRVRTDSLKQVALRRHAPVGALV